MAPTHPAAVLEGYPALYRPTGPLVPLGGAGGLSGSLLWRFDSGQGRLLLRAWPSPGPPIAHLDRVHRWLRETSGLGFVPAPLARRDGRTISPQGGRLWELVPWVDGAPPEECPPDRRFVTQAFSALAAFHNRLDGATSVGPSPGLLARLREVDDLRDGGLGALRAWLGGVDEGPVSTLGRRWVEEAATIIGSVSERLAVGVKLPVRRQPCLRDVRPDHFLFRNGTLVGLIDFGAMGEESVAGDLARLSSEWFDEGDAEIRREGWGAYESLRPLDANELRLVPIFEASTAFLIGAHWLRWHLVEGRTFEDELAVPSGLEKGIRLLRRLSEGTPGFT